MILERAELKDRKSTYFDRRDRRAESEQGWREVIAELVATGRFRDVPPERILGFIGNLLYGTIFSHHMSGRTHSLSSLTPDVLGFVSHALLAGPARPERKAGTVRRRRGRSSLRGARGRHA